MNIFVLIGLEKKLTTETVKARYPDLYERVPAIKNRLYRIAASTPSDDHYEERVLEKVNAMERHLVGVHDHPANRWYQKCEHQVPYRGAPMHEGNVQLYIVCSLTCLHYYSWNRILLSLS